MAAGETRFCDKCKKTIADKEFYGSNNLEKYPDGKLNTCKKCLTMHVDNWDVDTFLWILQECDVPYVPEEWNKLLAKYGQDRSKVTGVTIIGRYLSKMKLKQWKDYRWEHTQFLQELADKKTEEAMKRAGYDAAEITEVVMKNRATIPEGNVDIPVYDDSSYMNGSDVGWGARPQDDYFDNDNDNDNEIVDDLTDDDRRFLRLKWGKAYKPEEWVRLEQLYQEMKKSYDIQGAGHEDVLKLVCKASLKTNQLLDIGDIDGAQKMSKMYDMLMKSGKFTAAQNKAADGEFLNSISEFVVLCEKEGFIPRYYTDGPKDRVDETIQDLKDYTHSLVVEEMNLGNLIENAVKQMAIEESKEEDEDIEEEITFDELEALRDEDFADYGDFIEEQEMEDEELLKQIESGEI